MASVSTGAMTAEEFWDWASRPERDGQRWELVDGVPALRWDVAAGGADDMPGANYRHGLLVMWIGHLLLAYTRGRGRGLVAGGDAGLILRRRPDTLRGPDVMVHLNPPPGARRLQRHIEATPDLVVEVLSPSDRPTRTDRRTNQYLRNGVPLVWLVDPDDLAVSVHRPRELTVVLEGDEVLAGDLSLPGLELSLTELFAEITATDDASPEPP